MVLFSSATYLFTRHSSVSLLDCSPTVHKYFLLTIHHEYWKGGTWLWDHHQGFDLGFNGYKGFTNRIPWNLWLLTKTHLNNMSTFDSSSRAWKVVNVLRYTWQRWWYHITGVSSQLLGSHCMKKAQAVEPLWCNHRGTGDKIEEMPSCSWSFYTALLITLFLNDAGSIS